MERLNLQSRTPARALLVMDQPVLAGVVELALNHGTCTTRVASNAQQAAAVVKDWEPQLAVIEWTSARLNSWTGWNRGGREPNESRSSP